MISSNKVKFLPIPILTMLSLSITTSIGIASVDIGRLADCSDVYPKQSNSPYVLPYSIDTEFAVGQGNCTDGSHSEDQKYAYDFDMPTGTKINASRAGSVIDVEERFIDGNRTEGEENYIIIKHSDDSISGYYHLTNKGVFVDIDDSVMQGDVIGLSGDTGNSSEPHLHFEVLEYDGGDSLPVNFSNTRFHDKGLKEQESYKAKSL